MFVNFLIGWVILAVICEIYLRKFVVDSSGETPWPDDDSKAMARQYAKYDNDANSAKRRALRITYMVAPALAAFFVFVV
jgi:hypothetical protein